MARQARTRASSPIASHRLFPAFAALWFGALFGLGSLAVEPHLLEQLVARSRMDQIIPAATPPLGITARALVALVLAAAGSLAGLVLAGRIARIGAGPAPRKSDPAGEEPLSAPGAAPDETGAASQLADAPGGYPQRRRPLAISLAEPAFVPAEIAPVPGGPPQVLDIAALGLESEHPFAGEAPSPSLEEDRASAKPARAGFMASRAGSAQPVPTPGAIPAAPPSAAQPGEQAELASLAISDLASRLIHSIERRRAAEAVAPDHAAPGLPAFEEAEEEDTGDAFGSLLGMSHRIARDGSVGSSEDDGQHEPVVIFPGQAASAAPLADTASPPPAAAPGRAALDREGAERALRSALAGLQRMSGAA